jgi:putative transposase
VAIIDWYSRRVLSISNSMEAVFCVDCLEEALRTPPPRSSLLAA